MSFGVALRNAVAIGLGGIATLVSGKHAEIIFGNLLCENNDNLVLEDGCLILLD